MDLDYDRCVVLQNAQEQTIELSKFFVEYAARMSEANLRRLFRTAFSRVYDHATTGEHRDVMEVTSRFRFILT